MASSALASPATKVVNSGMSYVRVTFTGGTWGGTLVADNSKITLTGTDEGYTGSTLGTKTRTLSILKVERDLVGGNYLRLYPSEPLYNDGTGWTLAMQAAAITDGTDTSTEMSSTAIDWTDSTLDYPTVTNLPHWPAPYSPQTGSFDVWVGAFGGVFAEHLGILGIEAVTVEVTDGTTTVGPTTATWALRTRFNANGKYLVHPNWKASFNASSFANKAMLTTTIRVYPTIGDADSVRTRTWYVFNNKNNDYGEQDAYFDESYTIAGSGSGTFNDGDMLTQATTGARCIVWGSGQGGGASITVAGMSAAPNSSDLWTTPAVGTAVGTWTPSAAPVAVIGASAGTVGDVNDPFPDAFKAAKACQTANTSSNKASFSTIYAKTAYALGRDTGLSNRADTTHGPIYVKPWADVPGGTSRIVCVGSFGSAGMRTACIELWDHTVIAQIQTSGSPSNMPGGDQAIGMVNMTIDGTLRGGYDGGANMHPTAAQWGDAIWYIGCRSKNLQSGMVVLNAMAVDCYKEEIGEDIYTGTNNMAIINCNEGSHVAGGAHASVCQNLLTGNENRGAMWCDWTRLDVTNAGGSGTTAGCFTLQGSGITLKSAGLVGCTFAKDMFQNTSREGDVDSFFQWFCMLGRERWDDTGGVGPFSNIFYYGCVIDRLTGSHLTDLPPGAFRNCHEIATSDLSAWGGLENTVGSTYADLFVDPSPGGDWTPKAGSVLLDRVPVAFDGVMPHDAQGRTLSVDAAARPSIGALQPTAVLGVAYDGTTMSDGGSVSKTAGSRDLVMSVTGPTGAVVDISDVAFSGTVSGAFGGALVLTSGGTTDESTITTTLAEGSAGIDITYDNGTVFDFDITGTSAAIPRLVLRAGTAYLRLKTG